MIDLYGLIVLIVGWALSGAPDEIRWHAGVGLSLEWGAVGGSASIVLSIDPTPIRYRPAPYFWTPYTCGLTDGYNVWIADESTRADLGCLDTLQHEMNHVQQRRAFGVGVLFMDREAHPSYTAHMWVPGGNTFSLFRFALPLRWDWP